MVLRMAEIERLQEICVGGETSIDDEVIGAIAGLATREIDGVCTLGTSSIRRTVAERVGVAERRVGGVAVQAGAREVTLDIEVKVVFGYSIPETVVKVRQNVARRVLELCGLISKEINIKVGAIEFPNRMPGRVE